ncbi:MAG: presenilin family intramembrane aspartyl protease [Nanoarchaeota archaeon]|nr:presenilin family intramembrane aspartyl protease [Nanoarchaeota archaeon]
MKHNIKTTSLLLGLFFLAQVIGLFVIQNYIDLDASTEGEAVFKELPFDLERPPLEQSTSFLYIVAAILVGTCLVLLLIKFNKTKLWKIWYWLAVVICLTISLSAFIPAISAMGVSIVAALYKVRKNNSIIHNLTELFIYGGLAAIFVPVINVSAAILLLLVISVYDYIAVNKVKHMVTMAKFQTKTNVFAGLIVGKQFPQPSSTSKKLPSPNSQKMAILGGGDIGFALLFSGVIFKGLIISSPATAFLKTLVIPLLATVFLGALLFYGKKGKFYPAMPAITVGCLLGYAVTLVL